MSPVSHTNVDAATGLTPYLEGTDAPGTHDFEAPVVTANAVEIRIGTPVKRDATNEEQVVPCAAGDAVFGVVAGFVRPDNPGEHPHTRAASEAMILQLFNPAGRRFIIQEDADTDATAVALDDYGRPTSPDNTYDFVVAATGPDTQWSGFELDSSSGAAGNPLKVIGLAGANSGKSFDVNREGAHAKLVVEIVLIET